MRGCNTTQEAYHWISILRPSESIEDILEDPLREEFLKDTDYENRFDEWIDINDRKVIRDAINTLSEREQEILIRRYGFVRLSSNFVRRYWKYNWYYT